MLRSAERCDKLGNSIMPIKPSGYCAISPAGSSSRRLLRLLQHRLGHPQVRGGMTSIASSSIKTNRAYQKTTPTTYLILCFLLLIIPVGQILVHTLAGSGIWHLLGFGDVIISDNKQPIGLLLNPTDNLQYVSLALQNKLGFHLLSNLYTAQSHASALFNLYFFIIGLISRLFSVQPLAIMTLTSFFTVPFVGWMIFLICKQLK